MSLQTGLFLALGFGQSLAIYTSTTGEPFSSTQSIVEAITTGDVNYFVDRYNEITNNAYPLDLCVATGELPDAENVIYTCINNDTIARTTYEDGSCTNPIDNTTVYFTQDDIQSTGLYDFNCVGSASYVATEYCVSPDRDDCDNCISSVTTYTAVGVCYYDGGVVDDAQSQIDNRTYDAVTDLVDNYACTTCDGDSANYLSSLEGELEELTTYSYCSEFDSVKILGQNVPVNSQIRECVIDGEVQTASPTDRPTNVPSYAPTVPTADPTEAPTSPTAAPVDSEDPTTSTAPDDSGDVSDSNDVETTDGGVVVDGTNSVDESTGVMNGLSGFILLVSGFVIYGNINA